MSDYRLNKDSQRVYCGQDRWRLIDGSDPHKVEAEVKVNPRNGMPNPRIQLSDGTWVHAENGFGKAFKSLKTAKKIPVQEKERICGESLTPLSTTPPTTPPSQPTYPLRVTGSLDVTGIVSAKGGHSHQPFASALYPDDSIYPNASVTLEWRPIKQILGVFEFIAGPTAFATQPAGAPYGGVPNSVPFDVPQLSFQANAGLFCAGAGRRYERLGPPVDAVRADLRTFPLVSVPFVVSPYGQTVLEMGLCSDVVTWWNFISLGPDRHWKDNNSAPYGGTDLLLNFGFVSLAAHYQIGPDQDNDTVDLRQTADVAVTIGDSSDTAQFTGYGWGGAEQRPGSGGLWQPWGAGYGFLRIRPQGSLVSGVFRAGGNYLPPLRSGLPAAVTLGQFSGGVAVYPFSSDILKISAMVDVLATFDGSRPFNDGPVLPRGMFQVSGAYPIDIGTPRK